MAFQVSPGVNVSEIDLTTVVPSVATTTGAIAGVFGWGPVGRFSLVDSENTLATRFGKPTNNNFETFFTAANFLSYGNRLYVSRAAVTTGTSNTQSVSLTGTVYGLVYDTAVSGVSVGDGVYGSGIPGDSVTVAAIETSTVVETFNASSAVAANGFITVGTNNLVDGEKIVYSDGGGTEITELTDGATYFVRNSNTTGFYVSTVYGGTAITLTAGASESQTFTRTGQTRITFSSAATLGNSTAASEQSTNFFDVDYSFNAVANSTASVARSSSLIKNSDHYETVTVPSGVEFVARYPGELGNSLKVSVCDTVDQYSSTINPYALTVGAVTSNSTVIPGTSGIAVTVNASTANVYVANSGTFTDGNAGAFAAAINAKLVVGDYIEVGNTSINKQKMKIKTVGEVVDGGSGTHHFTLTLEEPYKLSTNFTSTSVSRFWEFHNVIPNAPGTSDTVTAAGGAVVDQVSIVVSDEDGKFSGVPGTVLETFPSLSRATDAKAGDGTTQYYKTVVNDFSRYVWATNDRSGAASAAAASIEASTETTPYSKSFVGGRDGVTESHTTIAHLASAYDLFADATSVDISLLMTGKGAGTNGVQLPNYLIDNIAEVRKDCVVFVSPEKSDVFGAGADGSQATNVIGFRNNMRASSYAVMDSGYKYQYDKYNDVYRWVPLNGDAAGMTARSDDLRDPWFSPAGFTRGQIKNVVKLAWNPNKAERDELYKKDINPVVTFPGQGTVLFGDKTLLGKPSAFDRINVRRLFIILEKAIATAANSTLFEFNDEFTRAQFKNLVEPFLRDVQGRRGIYDFRVVCDETNNTAEVVDGNRFVGDIYIKPAKSINFIQLNFVAVRSGVEFTEVVGQF